LRSATDTNSKSPSSRSWLPSFQASTTRIVKSRGAALRAKAP
jgi:hypothetical protein